MAAQFHAKKPDKHIFTAVATLVAVPTLTLASPPELLSTLHYLVSQLLRLATPRPLDCPLVSVLPLRGAFIRIRAKPLSEYRQLTTMSTITEDQSSIAIVSKIIAGSSDMGMSFGTSTTSVAFGFIHDL